MLQSGLPFALPPPLLLGGNRRRALVAIDTVVHQGVTGIKDILHRVDAVALLAFGDVFAGEHQIIDDRRSVGPGLEQVVALEKGVVAITGMGDHQRLHGDGVLLHQVSDTRVGVDHDLVGQPHLPAPIAVFHLHELFAEGPVVVTHRHAHGRIGVHHLFRGNDLDLVGVGVKGILAVGQLGDRLVIAGKQVEVPVGAGGQQHQAASMRLWNSWRKTG